MVTAVCPVKCRRRSKYNFNRMKENNKQIGFIIDQPYAT
jgi:hypothetical protein